MANILFIHGGAQGAWCWAQVSSALSLLGHECYSIDLPGHGEDNTPLAHITRQDYLDAVSNAIKALAWQELTLIGHSNAGMLLGDLAKAHSQVTRLIYIAGFVLNQGESIMDIISPAHAQEYAQLASQSVDNALNIDHHYAHKYYFTDINETHAKLYFNKLTPEPFNPFLDPVQSTPAKLAIEKHYIICERDQRISLETANLFAKKLKGSIDRLNVDHCAMLSNPSLLSEKLNAIITSQANA
ncbi:alpha/beta fold hydrolase [Shewanella surugensis]|uniref:Alpha/beta hydrolase n=1 Tax=Shewanella surugensis TaxID=212020 RepID=A0ABT0L9S9_9GAMM|nr:alpha/beta hydrolase [Shewanella surugensis]MCL1124471.1 alpha/beta hydrolase [Shewanella surugensis]